MEAYKFEATVQENGIIQIPKMASLAHQRIEIFVVVSLTTREETKPAQSLVTFLDEWRGVLKGFDPDKLRFQYLQEKYG